MVYLGQTRPSVKRAQWRPLTPILSLDGCELRFHSLLNSAKFNTSAWYERTSYVNHGANSFSAQYIDDEQLFTSPTWRFSGRTVYPARIYFLPTKDLPINTQCMVYSFALLSQVLHMETCVNRTTDVLPMFCTWPEAGGTKVQYQRGAETSLSPLNWSAARQRWWKQAGKNGRTVFPATLKLKTKTVTSTTN